MKTVRILVMLSCFIGTKTQAALLPDSIIIADRAWFLDASYNFRYALVRHDKKYTAYQSATDIHDYDGSRASPFRKKTGYVATEKITYLVAALSDKNYGQLRPENFGYNHEWLSLNNGKLYNYVKQENDHWTEKQKKFVRGELASEKNATQALQSMIGEKTYFQAMDRGIVFEAFLYFGRDSVLYVSADENILGMPWTVGENSVYNPEIPRLLAQLIPFNTANKSRLSQPEMLTQKMAQVIFDQHCSEQLYTSAPYRYHKALDELRNEFPVVEISEYGYHDGYVPEKDRVVKIRLHDTTMLPNVSVNLYLTKQAAKIYRRHSFRQKADSLAQVIQDVPFIRSYLEADTSRKLMIDIEDTISVNTIAAQGFNQSPERWTKYERLVDNWHWIDSLQLIPEVDPQPVLNISKKIYCGCDFRIDNNVLSKGIFFVIHDERHEDWSTWIMLPDSTLILWWIRGDQFGTYRFHRYESFGQHVEEVCRKFERNGKMIDN